MSLKCFFMLKACPQPVRLGNSGAFKGWGLWTEVRPLGARDVGIPASLLFLYFLAILMQAASSTRGPTGHRAEWPKVYGVELLTMGLEPQAFCEASEDSGLNAATNHGQMLFSWSSPCSGGNRKPPAASDKYLKAPSREVTV